MTNDQLYLIPNTLYNTGHTRGKPGQAGGCPGDAFRKFAKWTLKFPGNFHGNGNFWKFPEIPEVRSSFPGKTPPILGSETCMISEAFKVGVGRGGQRAPVVAAKGQRPRGASRATTT